MTLFSDCEFRGSESRKSKNGNEYSILRFEDDLGISFPFYVKSDSVIPIATLSKGTVYRCAFNYHYNSFERRNELDLIGVEDTNGK